MASFEDQLFENRDVTKRVLLEGPKKKNQNFRPRALQDNENTIDSKLIWRKFARTPRSIRKEATYGFYPEKLQKTKKIVEIGAPAYLFICPSTFHEAGFECLGQRTGRWSDEPMNQFSLRPSSVGRSTSGYKSV